MDGWMDVISLVANEGLQAWTLNFRTAVFIVGSIQNSYTKASEGANDPAGVWRHPLLPSTPSDTHSGADDRNPEDLRTSRRRCKAEEIGLGPIVVLVSWESNPSPILQ